MIHFQRNMNIRPYHHQIHVGQDVWKAVLKSQINLLDVDIKTYDVESGLTLVTKNNHSRIKNEKLQEIYEYKYFEKNFKEILNLIEFNL